MVGVKSPGGLSREIVFSLLQSRVLLPSKSRSGCVSAPFLRRRILGGPQIDFISPGLSGTPSRKTASRAADSEMEANFYTFGPYKIHPKEVFYSTVLSYAMVNLRPVLPGHILFDVGIFLFAEFVGKGLEILPNHLNNFPLGKHLDNIEWMLWRAHMVTDYQIWLTLTTPHVLVCPKREVKRFVDLTVEETSDLWLSAKTVGGQLEHHYNASSITFAIQDGPQAGQTVPHVHIHIIPRKGNDFEKNDEIYDAMDAKEKELKQTLDLDKERKDRTLEEMAEEADELRALFT